MKVFCLVISIWQLFLWAIIEEPKLFEKKKKTKPRRNEWNGLKLSDSHGIQVYLLSSSLISLMQDELVEGIPR